MLLNKDDISSCDEDAIIKFYSVSFRDIHVSKQVMNALAFRLAPFSSFEMPNSIFRCIFGSFLTKSFYVDKYTKLSDM